MKAWRIHLGWVIVTAFAIMISTRIASRQAAVSPPSGLERKPSSADPESPKTMATPIGKAELVSRSARPLSDSSLADRIRALLKTPEKGVELGQLLESAADRPFILLLLKEALFGEDLESCYGAIYQLGHMKGRDVAEVLESYLKTNGDKDQAHNVAGALGVLHDPGSMPVLTEALQSKNPQTRLSSAEALLGMGYSAPAEDLIASMARQYESPDGGVRKKAIETIGQFNLDAVVPVLTLGLKDSDSDVRMAALAGFLRINKPEYIPLLQPLLHDPVPEVAAQAEQFIEALKNP